LTELSCHYSHLSLDETGVWQKQNASKSARPEQIPPQLLEDLDYTEMIIIPNLQTLLPTALFDLHVHTTPIEALQSSRSSDLERIWTGLRADYGGHERLDIDSGGFVYPSRMYGATYYSYIL
jgi:hypothetical protein